MKNILQLITSVILFLLIPKVNFGQAPNLGTAAKFVLFSANGAVTNTGRSTLTGNVGAEIGAVSGFGNVDGQIHKLDGVTAACVVDVAAAFTQLTTAIADSVLPPFIGNGDTLRPGVYSITSSVVTLNLNLFLDAKGDPNAVFIFQIQGKFHTNAASKVHLINGAKACNVFWKSDGAVSMEINTSMKGTLIASAAIAMTTGDTLEGRALSTGGAIGVLNIKAYTPIGCGSIILNGPVAPALASTACYGLFSSVGSVVNFAGSITNVTGDVGTNSGATTGFDPLLVAGTIHPGPDLSTAQCKIDLDSVAKYLDSLSTDITLEFPSDLGHGLVLTPHTYYMDAAAALTDTIYLNAQGNANAVFVLKIKGAFVAATLSKVILINGAQAKNVFWIVRDAVTLNSNCVFNGTIISNTGALDLQQGVRIDGRAFTRMGIVNTKAVTVIIPPGCGSIPAPIITSQPANQIVCTGNPASFTVTATGSGLKYQWRKGSVNLTNTGNVSGVKTATLVINPASIADTSSFYNVIVSNGVVPNDTSANVSLKIYTAPLITAQPVTQTACFGNSVSFTVTATGTGLTYQWRRGIVNLVNTGKISGATSPTLTINPVNYTDTASNYNVVITGICGLSTTSNNVYLVINTVITTQPVNQTVCDGGAALFSVSAVGTGLTYQWRKGLVNLVNSANVSGAKSATLIMNPVTTSDASLAYNVVISGTCSPDITSNFASLTVNPTTGTPVFITGASTVCQDAPDGTYTATAANSTSITYSVTPVSAGVINPNTGVINWDAAFSGTASIMATANGTCGTPSVTKLVTVNATPIAIANSNSPVCAGSDILLTAQTVAGATYSWTGPGTYNSQAQNPVIASAAITDAGNYSLTVTANSCSSNPVITNVTVNNCSDLSITSTVDNMNPKIGHRIEFIITVNNESINTATAVSVSDLLPGGLSYISSSTDNGNYDPATGTWFIGNLNNGTPVKLSIIVKVFPTGNYTNTATVSSPAGDINSANNVSSITITPIPLSTPEGFSPNGDGINDVFTISGIENYPTNTLTVFSRWGAKVFSASSYQNNWDGKSNTGVRVGEDVLPVGTYFYTLDLGDGSSVIKGTIYLSK